MIKLIVTIDTFRGMACDIDAPSVERYQRKISSKGRLRSPESVMSEKPVGETASSYTSIIWPKSGLKIEKELLQYVDELYITQLGDSFECQSFFPSFESDFLMVAKGKIKQENNILFQHQVWRSKRLGKSPGSQG